MNPAHTHRNAITVALAVTVVVGAMAVTHGNAPLGATAHASATSHQAVRPGFNDLLTAPLAATAVSRDDAAAPVSPCRHNELRQLVVVSIEHQHAWACAGGRTELSTPVTTGKSAPGNRTPRGTFEVQGHTRDTVLQTSGGSRYPVHYWLPFRLGVWGFHDAPWQNIPFGTAKYVRHGSHGCVHVPTKAMRELFNWVDDGTTVRIR